VVERSDGRSVKSNGLATVSYLFGVPEEIPDADEAELAEASAQAEATAQAQEAARAALQAAAVAAAQALDAARAEAAAAVRAAEQLSSERPRTTPRLRAVSPAPVSGRTTLSGRTTSSGRDTSDGWYVDPAAQEQAEAQAEAETQAGARAESDPEPWSHEGHAGAPAPESQPAGAVAAARAFLSTVESQTAGAAPASSGVRFVAEDDDDADAADSTGRTKPPPVRQASINALARKGMSSAEMSDLLEAREVDPDEVVLEVQRLEAAGLLDDRVLAEHLVRTLQERKGLGRSAINAELRRRKVDQAAIDEALDTVDVDDELERCLEVAVKRASQLRSYDRATAERRLSAFLMRRGYAGSVISAAVAQALGPVGPRFR
jgi:regulatory protein